LAIHVLVALPMVSDDARPIAKFLAQVCHSLVDGARSVVEDKTPDPAAQFIPGDEAPRMRPKVLKHLLFAGCEGRTGLWGHVSWCLSG
jgi:hypothetical protein